MLWLVRFCRRMKWITKNPIFSNQSFSALFTTSLCTFERDVRFWPRRHPYWDVCRAKSQKSVIEEKHSSIGFVSWGKWSRLNVIYLFRHQLEFCRKKKKNWKAFTPGSYNLADDVARATKWSRTAPLCAEVYFICPACCKSKDMEPIWNLPTYGNYLVC